MKTRLVTVFLLLASTTILAQEPPRATSYLDMTDEELAQRAGDTNSWWAPGYGNWTGAAANNSVFNSQAFDAASHTQDTRMGVYPGMGTCTSIGGCAPPAGN